MRVKDLAQRDFSSRLLEEGLCFDIGPAVAHLCIAVEDAHGPLYELYSDFPVRPRIADTFVDTYLSCLPRLNPRNPLRRRVHLYIDGHFHAAVKLPRLSVPAIEWSLNWALATRLHQFVMLHAAIVARNDKALILPAPPGSGKSTLCAALVARGWRLLSDELTLLRPADGQAVPCPRPISLKEGSIAAMRSFAPERMLERDFPGTSKGRVGYFIPPPASVEAKNRTALPAWIALPKWTPGTQTRLTRISDTEAFIALNTNAVNYDLMGEIGPRVLTEIVRTCPTYQFEYGSIEAGLAGVEELTH